MNKLINDRNLYCVHSGDTRLPAQLPETLLNEELDVDRRFELCFEELRKGKYTFQAMTLPIKQAWCDLLRRWLRKWGAQPAFAVPLPDKVTCKGQPTSLLLFLLLILLLAI